MITHIVLIQPRSNLTEDERAAALETLSRAAAAVPEIRSFRLGRISAVQVSTFLIRCRLRSHLVSQVTRCIQTVPITLVFQ